MRKMVWDWLPTQQLVRANRILPILYILLVPPADSRQGRLSEPTSRAIIGHPSSCKEKIMRIVHLVTLLLLFSPIACSDETQSEQPTADVATEADTATTDTGTDSVVPDDVSVDTVETDAVEEVAEEVALPTCFEEDGERLVGLECFRDTDRVCLESSDCRDNEACEGATSEELGTCMYQIPESISCPGGPGCAVVADAPLTAGFARRVITPVGFEEARAEYIKTGGDREFIGDTEVPDTFFDCGRDGLCPGDSGYSEPDDDGSEGDGRMQGAWIAGYGHSRPAARCPDELLGDGCTAGNACCSSDVAHDDIWAVGAVFDQGDSRVAFVSLDVVGYFYNEVQRILARLPESLGVDMLIVASTHNHEAPDTLGQWGPGFGGGDLPLEPGWDDQHMELIREQIIAVVTEAVDNLEPVDIYAVQVDSGAVGFAVNDGRDPWIYDDDLALLHFVSASGDRADPDDTVGVIINWANHPESMDDANEYITSDFSGYVRDFVENGLPAVEGDEPQPAVPGVGGPVLYFSGALGGIIGPGGGTAIGRDGRSYRDVSWDKTAAIGERVAALSLETLPTASLVEGDLSFRMREFVTGILNLQFHTGFLSLALFDRDVVNWRHADGFNADTPPSIVSAVAGIQLGPITFATVPGEIFPEVIVGGFTEEGSVSAPVRGDHEGMSCMEDLLPPEAEDPVEQATHRCLISPTHANPPDLSRAPNSGFLKEVLPGEIIMIVGLGNDELGYLVPDYDYQLHEGAPYVAEAEGDHYEETNSLGPHVMADVLENLKLLWELDQEPFSRESD